MAVLDILCVDSSGWQTYLLHGSSTGTVWTSRAFTSLERDGVGVAMVTISMIVAIYYNVIMAYCLYYLFNTASSVLPWTVCAPEWLIRGAT